MISLEQERCTFEPMMSSNPSTSHDYSFTTVLKTINISESLLMTGRHFENVQNREWLLSRVFFVVD